MFYLRCERYIINKARHLETMHKLPKGTAEFITAMSTSFREVRGVPVHEDLELRRGERELPRQPRELEGEDRRERMDIEAPRQPQEPEVRPYIPTVSSSDDEGGAAPEREEMDIAVEGEMERSRQKRFMGPQDVHFTKWKRLIPPGCKPFPVVQKWHEFRVLRVGGAKGEEHQRNNMAYVNRFLAHCDFRDCDWRSITPDMVAKHDEELAKHFEAGTVARILQTILDFWTWAKRNKYIRRSHYDIVQEYLEGCMRANRKDVGSRNTQRRVDEAASLPEPEVLEQFETCEYVRKLREAFRTSPFHYLYDMACCLIVLCSFYNGPRVSVFHNIRFKDVDNATTDDGLEYTITVGKHKTSGTAGGRSKKAAFITVSKENFNDLLLYSRTIREIYRFIDPTATVFRSKAGKPLSTNKIGKMAKTAWKKAGMKVNMNLTILRKLSTVQGRKLDPSMAPSIARQLCHRQSTADEYYAVHDDKQEAVRVYRHLRKSFKPTATATVSSADAVETVSEFYPFSDEGIDSTLQGNDTTLPEEGKTTISESSITDDRSTLTADSDVIPPSITGESSPQFFATHLNLNPIVRLRRLPPTQISFSNEERSEEEGTSLLPQPQQSPERQMPVLSPAPKSVERQMPVLSPAPQRVSLVHASKYVPVIQFSPPAKYKTRMRLDPAKRQEIKEAYQEVIREYMMLPFNSVPIDAIRQNREDRWPELTEMQLRDVVRNLVKSARKHDILNNPDDYVFTE